MSVLSLGVIVLPIGASAGEVWLQVPKYVGAATFGRVFGTSMVGYLDPPGVLLKTHQTLSQKLGSPSALSLVFEPSISLGIQIAQSGSYLYTLGPKVGI